MLGYRDPDTASISETHSKNRVAVRHLECFPELHLVGVRFVNVHVRRDVMADPMIDELLVIFRKLELGQVLEVLYVLFSELFDFLSEAVDSLDEG